MSGSARHFVVYSSVLFASSRYPCRHWHVYGISSSPSRNCDTGRHRVDPGSQSLRRQASASSASTSRSAAAEDGLPERVRMAAQEGDAQAVAAWLDEGGGVDARCAERNDATLLMAAVFGGHEAIVRMLLQHGASVNLQEALGITALMIAVR